jgi:hypothetical protein
VSSCRAARFAAQLDGACGAILIDAQMEDVDVRMDALSERASIEPISLVQDCRASALLRPFCLERISLKLIWKAPS